MTVHLTQDNSDTGTEQQTSETTSRASGKDYTLEVDLDYYQSYLDDLDISEEQKREVIEALWTIVVAFVDLGFGINTVQNVLPDQYVKSNTGKPEDKRP